MNLSDFEKTAQLAKLNFDISEKASFEKDFCDMIEFAGMLSDANDIDMRDDNVCFLREDEPGGIFSKATMLSNAPLVRKGYVSVPKVL